MEVLFSQVTPPEIPPWQWWASFGVLGIAGLVALTCIAAYFFVVILPDRIAAAKQNRAHLKLKQQVEIEREEKVNAWIDTTRSNSSEELEHKRKTVEILDRMDKRQAEHANDCKQDGIKLDRLGQKIDQALRTAVRPT